jgi:hypothetical protein
MTWRIDNKYLKRNNKYDYNINIKYYKKKKIWVKNEFYKK